MVCDWLHCHIVLHTEILGNIHNDLKENVQSLFVRFSVYRETHEAIGTSGNTVVVPNTH